VLERLRAVDVSKITPIDALNLLNLLREMALLEAGDEGGRR
jgi:hypothetical protein